MSEHIVTSTCVPYVDYVASSGINSYMSYTCVSMLLSGVDCHSLWAGMLMSWLEQLMHGEVGPIYYAKISSSGSMNMPRIMINLFVYHPQAFRS